VRCDAAAGQAAAASVDSRETSDFCLFRFIKASVAGFLRGVDWRYDPPD
jgi:hypothetical protein